jgi:hypothetical protein
MSSRGRAGAYGRLTLDAATLGRRAHATQPLAEAHTEGAYVRRQHARWQWHVRRVVATRRTERQHERRRVVCHGLHHRGCRVVRLRCVWRLPPLRPSALSAAPLDAHGNTGGGSAPCRGCL